MSRFYFHIIEGVQVTPDEEGMELSSLLAAQAEAVASARDIAQAGDSPKWRFIQITDEAGDVLGSEPVLSH
jgi:hypothetical protein